MSRLVPNASCIVCALLCWSTHCILLLSATASSSSNDDSNNNNNNNNIDININNSRTSHEKIALFQLHITHIKRPLLLSLGVLCLGLFKILLHKLPALGQHLPESCLLLLVGIAFGSVASRNEFTNMDSTTFLYYLLPPIVLEAAYGLHSKAFYQNFNKIILFAVVGTLLNVLVISTGLFAVVKMNWLKEPGSQMNLLEVLLFSSLIVAVDPVAVLAIFEEIGVNLSLYFLVFGESLFNDAVTIVLYNIMKVLCQESEVIPMEVLVGVLSFFVVSVGGILVGLLCGVVSCLWTRFNTGIETFEPLIIFVSAYLSYLLGDMFGFSGIISLIVCGTVHSLYAFHNISSKSIITVKRATKMMAQLAEALIFFMLGMQLLGAGGKYFEVFFILWTLLFVLLGRALIVLLLCFLLNYFSSENISFRHQLIMIYGGLRGAVAYSLASIIPSESLKSHPQPEQLKNVLLSTTLIVILVTNLLMGTTMKPLVRLLHIKGKKPVHWSLFKKMNESVVDHLSAGLEEIIGHTGRHTLLSQLKHLDDRVLRRLLMRDPVTHDEKIIHTYEKVCMAMHLAAVHPHRSVNYLQKLPKGLHDLSVARGLNQWGQIYQVHDDDDDHNHVCAKGVGDNDDDEEEEEEDEDECLAELVEKVREEQDSEEEAESTNIVVIVPPRRKHDFADSEDIFKRGENLNKMRELAQSRYDDNYKSRLSTALQRRRISCSPKQRERSFSLGSSSMVEKRNLRIKTPLRQTRDKGYSTEERVLSSPKASDGMKLNPLIRMSQKKKMALREKPPRQIGPRPLSSTIRFQLSDDSSSN